jgi:hypothetical protein
VGATGTGIRVIAAPLVAAPVQGLTGRGTAVAQRRPTGMCAVHAASIAEVWLALVAQRLRKRTHDPLTPGASP